MAPLQRAKSGNDQTDQLQIQHFIHQHLLQKIFMTSEFNCDGCNTGGFGVRYRCSACDFDIHEQCATSSHRISSHLHPHHQLILVNRPGDSNFCDVCKGATNGLSYTCEIQTCVFNVHTLCVQIPVAAPSTAALGGFNSNQPVVINQQQQMQMQAAPATTVFGGYNGVNSSQPVMVNHHHQQHQQQMQGMHTMQMGGYNGVNNINNNNQTHMINHQQQQHRQQVMPATAIGGYHGVNNSQPVMLNQQQKQGGYQTQMINHHQYPQQQAMPPTIGGYQGGMINSQPAMVNHHHLQPQQQVMPTAAFNTNQQLMSNHHQQQLQQSVMIPPTAVGGYGSTVVNNNNQTVMIHHPPPQQQQQQQSSGYTKMGKFAANILSTSIIGVPIFNPR